MNLTDGSLFPCPGIGRFSFAPLLLILVELELACLEHVHFLIHLWSVPLLGDTVAFHGCVIGEGHIAFPVTTARWDTVTTATVTTTPTGTTAASATTASATTAMAFIDRHGTGIALTPHTAFP